MVHSRLGELGASRSTGAAEGLAKTDYSKGALGFFSLWQESRTMSGDGTPGTGEAWPLPGAVR